MSNEKLLNKVTHGDCLEVIQDTSFEGCECVECKLLFEPYDNAYTHMRGSHLLMCEYCYDKLGD